VEKTGNYKAHYKVSIPNNCFANKPITKEIAATEREIAAISPKRRKKGSSLATDI